MQDVDEYERHVHTTAQAAKRVHGMCIHFGDRFNYRLLNTFQQSIQIVMGLIISSMILDLTNDKPFHSAQLGVVGLLVFITVLMDYAKEIYTSKIDASTGAYPRHGYAHAFYQN